MNFKQINSKMKEIYFTAHVIEEEADTLKLNSSIWQTMSVMGIQNIAIQNMKMA